MLRDFNFSFKCARGHASHPWFRCSFENIYQPQRSCGQGYVFTRVCDSVHKGGLRAGRIPRAGRTPPGRENPPAERTPQAGRTPPPPGKHTPAYGQRAAGTHPTGMHSCFVMCFLLNQCNCRCHTSPIYCHNGCWHLTVNTAASVTVWLERCECCHMDNLRLWPSTTYVQHTFQ